MCCLRTLKTILNTKRKPITSNCLFRVCTVCVHPSKTPPDVRIKNNFASKHSTWPDRNIYTEKSLPVSHTLVCSRKRDRENLDVTAVLLRFTPKKPHPPPPKNGASLEWVPGHASHTEKIAIWIRCGWCSKSKTNFLHFFFLFCLYFSFAFARLVAPAREMVDDWEVEIRILRAQKGFKKPTGVRGLKWNAKQDSMKNNGDIVYDIRHNKLATRVDSHIPRFYPQSTIKCHKIDAFI